MGHLPLWQPSLCNRGIKGHHGLSHISLLTIGVGVGNDEVGREFSGTVSKTRVSPESWRTYWTLKNPGRWLVPGSDAAHVVREFKAS